MRLVGVPGGGKTVLGRHIGERLGVPVLEVDAVVRRPGGRVAGTEEYRAACAAFLAGAPEGWVVDGDDREQVALRYADADVVLWLDVPRWVAVVGLARRRAWGLLRWTWRQHAAETCRYAALAAADPDRWVRLRGRRAATAWLLRAT